MNMFHRHPRNRREAVLGTRVRCGQRLKRGDKCDSAKDKWESIPDGPDGLIGTIVRKDDVRTYIRPAKENKRKKKRKK